MHALNLIDFFLEMLTAERGCAKNTRTAYHNDLLAFVKHVSPTSLENVTPQQITDFMHVTTTSGFTTSTQSRRLSALRQFYAFLQSENITTTNPTSLIDAPKSQRPLPKTLTKNDIEKLLTQANQLDTPNGYRMLAMLELMYASGLRVSELVSLPRTVLPLQIDVLEKRPYLMVTGKGGRERIVPLNKPALEALKKYMTVRPAFLKSAPLSEKWLFPSRGKDGHLTRHRFFQLIKELAGAAGIDPEKVSPHIIRHAFATHLLQGGADLLAIQKLLGHVDITTTQIYTHVAKDHLVDVVTHHHPLATK